MGVRPLLALQHGNPVTSRGVKGVSGLLSIEVGRGFFKVVAGASGFASSCDGELGKPLESKQGIWASSQDEVGEHGVLLPLRLETRGFS